MTELYSAIYTKLANDATLVGLLGHTEDDRRIRRGWQPCLTPLPCVTFDRWSGVLTPVAQELGNRQPHEIMVRFSIWAPETVPSGGTVGADLLVGKIEAALIDALHGRDIGTADLRAWYCRYDDFSPSVEFDEELRAWTQVLRFKCMVKAL